MALEYVLHSRYHGGTTQRNSSTYGNSKQGTCGSRLEAASTSETIDASRQLSVFGYFDGRPNINLPGSAGIFPAGSGNAETADFDKQAVNRVANFQNDVYNLVGNKVYRWDDDTLEWIVSVTLTGKSTIESSSIGLYPVFANGQPRLFTAWHTSGGNWRTGYLDGETNQWVITDEVSLVVPNDGLGGIINEHQHSNRIYFTTNNILNIFFADFESGTVGAISWNGEDVLHPMDFATYFGKLYCLNKASDDDINLWQINEGGIPILRATFNRTPSEVGGIDFGSALTSVNNFEGRNLLYVDHVSDDDVINNPNLIAYNVMSGFSEKIGTIDNTNHGFGSVIYRQSNPNGALVNLAAGGGFAANPLKMMTNQAGVDSPAEAKGEGMVLRSHVNQHEKFRGDLEFTAGRTAVSVCSRFGMFCSNPLGAPGGGDANTLFQHVAAPSGTWTFFAFQKEGRHRSFPHEQIGGGGRISVVKSDGSKIIGVVFRGSDPIAGGDGLIRIFYSLNTTTAHPNGTPVNVRWFYDKDGHAPERPCTLVDASVGSISGNIVFNVIAESGNIRSVDWDAKGDGIINSSKINLNGLVAVTGVDGAAITAIDSPQDLFGLALWLDSSDVSTISSGTGVSSIGDKSGAGVVAALTQATAGSQPEYLFGQQNGLNGIGFDGTDDYLFAPLSPVSGHPTTILMVFEPRAAGGPQYAMSMSNNNTFTPSFGPSSGVTLTKHEHISNYNTGTTFVVESTETDRAASGTAPRDNSHAGVTLNIPHFLSWKEIEFEAESRIDDGTAITTDFIIDGEIFASGLGNITLGRFTGAEVSGAFPGAGDFSNYILYELAIYSGIISDTDIAKFKLYAENKWGL